MKRLNSFSYFKMREPDYKIIKQRCYIQRTFFHESFTKWADPPLLIFKKIYLCSGMPDHLRSIREKLFAILISIFHDKNITKLQLSLIIIMENLKKENLSKKKGKSCNNEFLIKN
jgi:hypothetical protein